MRYRHYTWPVHVIASTHRPDGRKVTLDRIEEGAGDVERGIRSALSKRRDGGHAFLGCGVTAITPLGQRIERIVEIDRNGEIRLEVMHD